MNAQFAATEYCRSIASSLMSEVFGLQPDPLADSHSKIRRQCADSVSRITADGLYIEMSRLDTLSV